MNQEKKTRDAYLGIELGSTRIKAVLMDGRFAPIASAGYTWASRYENGIWTYDLALVWEGLSRVLAELKVPEGTVIRSAGVSAMMHGYLAFDKDWNLLVPFPHLAEYHHPAGLRGLNRAAPFQHSPALERGPPVSGIAEWGRTCSPGCPPDHPGGLCAFPAYRRECAVRGRCLRHVPHQPGWHGL